MRNLFKKLYIITLFELLVLLLFLLWSPSEEGSQFLLGRSLFRWVLAIPAIVFFILGLSFYVRHSGKKPGSIDFLANGPALAWDHKGTILLLINTAFIVLLILCVLLSDNFRLAGSFIRILPWFVFLGILIWQWSYWMVVSARDKGEALDFGKSAADLPMVLKSFVFDEHVSSEVGKKYDVEKLHWISVSMLIFVFLVVGCFLIRFAGLNSDEGWYLYAARLVYSGQRPYQDFAFTQMPLLPYIYGAALSVLPSMYTGRLVSLIIQCASLFFLYAISKKVFNREAFIWILFLVVTNSDAFYFNTIVKTYSLTLLFLLASLYLWLSTLKPEVKYPMIFFVLLLGFFTRLTFSFYAFFVVVKMAVEIWSLQNRRAVLTRIMILNVPLVLAGLSLLYPTPRNFIWNVYTYNAGIHGFLFSANTGLEYMAHLKGYLRSVKVFWPLAVPLILAVISGIYYRNLKKEKLALLFVAGFSIFIFFSVHFLGAGPMYEYYVPATTFLFALILWFLFSFSGLRSGINFLILWTSRLAVAVIALTLIHGGGFGIYNYEYYHGHPPIETIQELAGVVNRYYPGYPIFTLEALYVAVEAGREVPSGLSMAQFSILDLPTEEAQQLHFINQELLVTILQSEDTKILVLNEREAESLRGLIENSYTNVFEISDFGQKSIKAYVFVRDR